MARVVGSVLALLIASSALAFAARAQWPNASVELAPNDFDPSERGWNGLSAFVEIAGERNQTLEVVGRLDLGTLQPTDAIVIVHPTEDLPGHEVAAFMRAGGRVVLADDFGAGDSLLRLFRIGRGAPSADAPSSLRLRGNPDLLVARPLAPHPLSEGVGALVTNHPRVLFHADLEPIFVVADHDALVFAGAVGAGRLVALGDPSVFINNMLELEGNRRFAENLLVYIGAPGGRVLLVPPSGRIVGRFGEPGADRPLHDLRRALEDIERASLPPLAIRLLGLAVVILSLILVASVLPRSSPYSASAMFRDASVAGGFWGRVTWYRARPDDLVEPALVLGAELERAVGAILVGSSASRPSPEDVAFALRRRGASDVAVEDARRLWSELGSLMSGATNGTAAPVNEARFRAFVARADALLRALGGSGLRPEARRGPGRPRAAEPREETT